MRVDFTETFDGETVLLCVARERVERVADLRTDPRTARARSLDVDVAPGETRIEARLDGDSRGAEVSFRSEAIRSISISLAAKALRIALHSHEDYRHAPTGFA